MEKKKVTEGKTHKEPREIRDANEIQLAHDIYEDILAGEFPRMQLSREQLLIVQGFRECLCWILCHKTSSIDFESKLKSVIALIAEQEGVTWVDMPERFVSDYEKKERAKGNKPFIPPSRANPEYN